MQHEVPKLCLSSLEEVINTGWSLLPPVMCTPRINAQTRRISEAREPALTAQAHIRVSAGRAAGLRHLAVSGVMSITCAVLKRCLAVHVGGITEGGSMASSVGLALCGQALVVRGGSRFLATSTASR